MASLRDIKIRIESIRSTRQITNAMKMVAAAKLRKAQNNIINARPYADHINRMLQTIKSKNKSGQHPLLHETSETGKTALIIVTSDRGLCGAFNSNILRKAEKYINENPDVELICLGKKSFDYVRKHIKKKMIEHISGFFNEMDFSVSKNIASLILQIFSMDDYSRIDILYNEFKSAIQQNVIVKQLLPIVPIESETISTLDYLYEPDEKTVIEELGRKFIDVEIWRVLLESSAAEQAARMTSMDSATENAKELIEELTLNYNRVRQANITTEISEISSGAEALK